MRLFTCALIALFVVSASVSAQPAGENLDTVLGGWEKAMTDLKSFVAVVDRVTDDKALNVRDQHKGYAMFMKPNRARLELGKVTNPKIFEKYICTGTFLYEFAPVSQKVRIHDMPQNKKEGKQQESFLTFLFGMSAEDAKRRYDMRIAYPKNKEGKEVPDPNYHYILIRPKLDQDRSDFIEARLSLYRDSSLPAQIWYLQPNKNEITWTFTKLQINVQIPVTYFEKEVPKGWTEERVLPAAPPAAKPVIRN